MTPKRTYRFNADTIAAIQNLQMVIRVKYPGDPEFADVLEFDPYSETPQPEVEAKIRNLDGRYRRSRWLSTGDSMGHPENRALGLHKRSTPAR